MNISGIIGLVLAFGLIVWGIMSGGGPGGFNRQVRRSV